MLLLLLFAVISLLLLLLLLAAPEIEWFALGTISDTTANCSSFGVSILNQINWQGARHNYL